MTTPPDPERDPLLQEEDEPRQAQAAAEFTAALQAFESAHPEPAAKSPERADTAPRVGQRIRGRVVALTGDVMLLDVGGRGVAVADAREFRDESSEPTVKVAYPDALTAWRATVRATTTDTRAGTGLLHGDRGGAVAHPVCQGEPVERHTGRDIGVLGPEVRAVQPHRCLS